MTEFTKLRFLTRDSDDVIPYDFPHFSGVTVQEVGFPKSWEEKPNSLHLLKQNVESAAITVDLGRSRRSSATDQIKSSIPT
ncbi:MAG: hypothetical protein O7G86_01910, partial [Gammaproteobacteria bacterium]|nr:hypothetical protein [Gammaproteobacteria bacterium]